jgi:hypothetical protein
VHIALRSFQKIQNPESIRVIAQSRKERRDSIRYKQGLGVSYSMLSVLKNASPPRLRVSAREWIEVFYALFALVLRYLHYLLLDLNWLIGFGYGSAAPSVPWLKMDRVLIRPTPDRRLPISIPASGFWLLLCLPSCFNSAKTLPKTA